MSQFVMQNNSTFDVASGNKLTLFGNYSAIENNIFAVDSGKQYSSAPTYEFLSMETDGTTAALTPTTINIGSSTPGTLVTTNIQSQINNVGQTATGMLKTNKINASIAFKEAEAVEGTGSNVTFNVDGATITARLNSRPLKLSSFTGLTYNEFDASAAMENKNIESSTLAGTGGDKAPILPAAVAGAIVVYEQAVPITGTDKITFTCAGSDVFATESVAPNPNGDSDAKSIANDTKLVFDPNGSGNNYFNANSLIVFQCVSKVISTGIGTWFVDIRPIPKRGNNTTGSFSWTT